MGHPPVPGLITMPSPWVGLALAKRDTFLTRPLALATLHIGCTTTKRLF